jgi:hypothetical protein
MYYWILIYEYRQVSTVDMVITTYLFVIALPGYGQHLMNSCNYFFLQCLNSKDEGVSCLSSRCSLIEAYCGMAFLKHRVTGT